MVKFQTEAGICTIYNGQEVFLTEEDNDSKISLDAQYPAQLINIGPTLSREGTRSLIQLLLRNRNVFAWTPSNMTGVPRKVAEHQLQVRENYRPVAQKKRGMATERSLDVAAEVDKLVSAGILKEVQYHTWITNPVMVRKHDGTWRMCVDFKDLNKLAQRIAILCLKLITKLM
ncbi:hypothetical protein E3N88_00506 [Mikania micrantha]|uniref:Reverse transcriptase domain-containing protein n=1 Tax=Mikania micrantha TaxID=192012 RepID=A0A5N6Q0Z4_9ASTR|nr:hypothetical protein E3N88_00506 [Mikania micrantha]